MEKETKEICNFLVNAIIIGLIALFAAINYQTGSNLKKQNEGIEKQLWDIRLKHYGFYNETKDWIAFHQYYFNSTKVKVAELEAADESFSRILSEELSVFEDRVRDEFAKWLLQINLFLMTEIDSLAVITSANEHNINLILANLVDIRVELRKADALVLALYKHVSQKKGLFRHSHDQEVESLLKKQVELIEFIESILETMEEIINKKGS